MNRSSAVSIIQNRVGQRTGLDSQIIAELQLAQAELEGAELLPWFLIKEANPALVTVASSREVSLPSDFLRETEEEGFWRLNSDGTYTELFKDDYKTLLGNMDLSGSGAPTHYAVVNNKLHFFPIPDAVYTLKSFYFGQDTSLATDVENNWLKYAPGLLIARAGMQLARFLRDNEAVGLFSSDLSIAWQKLSVANAFRASAGRKLEMGG